MAEGLVLSLVLTSHIGWDQKFNDVHPMVSYNYQNYSLGVFRNSLNHTSLFVSKTSEFDNVSVQYGVASNYGNRVIPMIVIRKNIADRVNFLVSPSYNKTEKRPGLILGIEVSY